MISNCLRSIVDVLLKRYFRKFLLHLSRPWRSLALRVFWISNLSSFDHYHFTRYCRADFLGSYLSLSLSRSFHMNVFAKAAARRANRLSE